MFSLRVISELVRTAETLLILCVEEGSWRAGQLNGFAFLCGWVIEFSFFACWNNRLAIVTLWVIDEARGAVKSTTGSTGPKDVS